MVLMMKLTILTHYKYRVSPKKRSLARKAQSSLMNIFFGTPGICNSPIGRKPTFLPHENLVMTY